MSKCPICQNPSQEDFRPFCSKGCKTIDLHRWFKGSYNFPSTEPVSEEDFKEALPLTASDNDNK